MYENISSKLLERLCDDRNHFGEILRIIQRGDDPESIDTIISLLEQILHSVRDEKDAKKISTTLTRLRDIRDREMEEGQREQVGLREIEHLLLSL
ncbi:MAG: hypothetical protein Q8K26_02615 [Candidatus Gracilibacteria bacterium]|nr:hypothetical protein [Candidatus Gracilibacteria bacterium]